MSEDVLGYSSHDWRKHTDNAVDTLNFWVMHRNDSMHSRRNVFARFDFGVGHDCMPNMKVDLGCLD